MEKKVLIILALAFFSLMILATFLELGRNDLDNFAHYFASRDCFKQQNSTHLVMGG